MSKYHHSDRTKQVLRQQKLGKKLSATHRAKVIKTLCNEPGDKNPNWKGGKTTTKEGYVLLRLPSHPNARSNGYYAEHRYVMEQQLGRYLEKEEVVHHLNGVKTDNRPENLALLSHHLHGKLHWDTPEAKAKQSEHTKKARANRFWSTKKIIS